MYVVWALLPLAMNISVLDEGRGRGCDQASAVQDNVVTIM